MINISAKKISAIMLTIAVILSLTAVILSFALDKPSEKLVASTQSVQSDSYVLKDYNGHLAVFHGNEKSPYKEFEIYTNSFSDYDKQLLEKGIKANTEEKINQIIEDYTS